MTTETKQIHLNCPLALYEDFFRMFPGRGERTAYLNRAILTAIELRPLIDEILTDGLRKAAESVLEDREVG